MNNFEDKNALALEYVLGTLREEEREVFKKQLATDNSLMKAVQYWESTLMASPENVPELAPKPDTFKKIQVAIQPNSEVASSKSQSIWERLLPWKVVTGFAFAMLLVVSTLYVNNSLLQPAALNTDYVAVLVDGEDKPVLTALTASDGNTLWLKWEKWQASEQHSLQLWAKSRRDGQIRPLLVFNQSELTKVQLDEATLRLIQDSSHLIMTQEEVGGSAFDEPSDIVIAKGVCIRLQETKDSA